MRTLAVAFVVPFALACGGGGAASPGPKAADYGLQLPDPEGWTSIEPDASAEAGTVLMLRGPERAIPASIEITRRKLSITDAKKPAHLTTQAATGMLGQFQSFEMDGVPGAETIEGRDVGVVKINFNESDAAGGDVARKAYFFGIVHKQWFWLVRCLGDGDGKDEATFRSIVAALKE